MSAQDHDFAGMLSVEHDLPPFIGAVKAYVVCSTPRTGSTLLCDALAASGRLGVPAEYFHREAIATIASRFGAIPPGGKTLDLRVYVEGLMRHRTSPEGWFGMKCHFDQLLTVLGKDAVRSLLTSSRFIRIARRDRLAQAISYEFARQSDLWHVRGDAPGAAPAVAYDKALLDAAFRAIVWHEARWDLFFEANGIRPLQLWYEDLSARPAEVAAEIRAFLGLSPDVTIDCASTSLRRLSGDRKSVWRERFLDDLRFRAR